MNFEIDDPVPAKQTLLQARYCLETFLKVVGLLLIDVVMSYLNRRR